MAASDDGIPSRARKLNNNKTEVRIMNDLSEGERFWAIVALGWCTLNSHYLVVGKPWHVFREELKTEG